MSLGVRSDVEIFKLTASEFSLSFHSSINREVYDITFQYLNSIQVMAPKWIKFNFI